MESKKLRSELMEQLWQLSKLDIMSYICEITEGETAVLYYLYNGDSATPSQISDALGLSRSRVANILRTLRGKDCVTMVMADDDRRKMLVSLTAEGREQMQGKIAFLESYVDLYMDELGDTAATVLTDIIKKTVGCQSEIVKKLGEFPSPKTKK
ncbi:MAG: MarR family winged helix-turn-helix transcriptional regulator [Clostridia bacterium]|nr:MarR family winged helix-turn-helix transcriptional regulator [Clostridia bacterium]